MIREELELFFKYFAIKLEKKEAIKKIRWIFNLTEEDALKEYDKWRREWCNPLINKEF
ncbi:hypothetical protein I9Y31_003253 [Clostridium perfringens]|nr:hypothetical protein [Clostridium perfringens]